jgi:hypothetical protein
MIALLLGVTAMAGVQLERPGEVGVETVIVVHDDQDAPRPGQTVRVVFRPGLAGEREQAVGITDGRGRVRWTPNAAGLAKIRAGEAWQTVSVAGPWALDTGLLLAALLAVGAVSALVGVRLSGWRRS